MRSVNPAQVSITTHFARLEEQRRHSRNDPRLRDVFGTIYVAITTVLLAYGGLLGAGAILLMYAIWLPKIVYKGVFLLRPTADVIVVMLLPMFAIMSIAWSDYPYDTLKSALEYTSLIVCTVIIAKIVRMRPLIRGLVVGSTVALMASLISGQRGLDPFTGQDTLVGLFGSKNMIGLFAEIGTLSSLLGLFVRQSILAKIVYAVGPLGICLIALYMSKSASSELTLFLTLSVVLAAGVICRFPRSIRGFSLAGFTLLFLIVTSIGVAYDAQDLVLKSLGKDHTLTGRTYLWQEGIKNGMKEPFLGHGYQAFWVVGRPKAELLWQKFGVASRKGFHFHDLFIETFVELGMIGVFLLSAIMLTTCWKSMRLVIREGMSVEHVYALGTSFLFLTRAIVEVDLIGTFMIGPVLYFSVIPRLYDSRRRKMQGVCDTQEKQERYAENPYSDHFKPSCEVSKLSI